MKMRRSCTGIPIALWLLAASSTILAQKAPPAVPQPQAKISVTSRLVLVDVVVRHDGQPACGLNQQDFQVRENGHPQEIQSFEAHCASKASATEIQSPPLPPDTYTDLPVATPVGAVNVLLLDGLNTHTRDEIRAREQMIESLRTLPPGRRIAIFALGSRLQMLAGFTTDTSVLVKALAGVRLQQSTMLVSQQEKADEEEILNKLRQMPGGVEMANQTEQFLNGANNQQSGDRMVETLAALQQLARYLAGIPGRKNLLWFSGSFPIETFQSVPLPNGSTQHRVDQSYGNEVRKTADLLAAARVAVYPVDVRGAMTEPLYDLQQMRSIAVQQTLADEQQDAMQHIAERGTLQAVAQETGGRAIYESNDLANDMAGAIEDGSDYYTIAYSPMNTDFDGVWRKIQVQVAAKPEKGKYQLGYRNGYFALPDRQQSAGGSLTNSFAAAMRQGMPSSSQILFDVRVLADSGLPTGKVAGQNEKLQKRVARYRLDYAAAVKDMHLDAAPGGGHSGELLVQAVAFSRDGQVVNSTADSFRYALNPDQWNRASAKGLQIHQQIDLPAGAFLLRMGLCDPFSGHIGTVEIPLQVSAAREGKSAAAK